MRQQGEGGGSKTAKNETTSFMDGPLGVIQQGVGRWSVKCLHGLDRYSKNESKMSTFVYKG